MNKDDKIYVAGHRGMVGSAIKRRLGKEGYTNIIVKTSKELDLTNQAKVDEFFSVEKPDYVFLAAAKVGGIMANIESPGQFIYDNLMISTNVIHAAYKNNVKKLMFLGSSCIYPRNCPQPMKEEYLLDGKLEPTNEAYALAKISGLKMCEYYNKQYNTNFISVMPSNIYGENDNFSKESSHVVAALIRKFHEAKVANNEVVEIWGTGKARREFIYVDDVADACVYLMNEYSEDQHVNIGTGEDVSIKELAEIINEVIGFKGRIEFNTDKPDGMPRKLCDVSKLHSLGWNHRVNLKEGIAKSYKWFIDTLEEEK